MSLEDLEVACKKKNSNLGEILKKYKIEKLIFWKGPKELESRYEPASRLDVINFVDVACDLYDSC